MVMTILPFLLIALIAVVAPLVSELPIGFRLPIVVVEIALGVLVGPHVLHLISVEGVIGFLGNLGLAFLFFLAGLEIDLASIGGRPLSLATRGWLLSFVLALALSGLLYAVGFVRAPLLVAAALTTTAIGTLLPILRDAGELQTHFGSFILAAGAIGEFGPREDRFPFALYAATALPLVVAITEIGVATGRMRTDNAAALVGAGMPSVLLFPLIALTLRRRTTTSVFVPPRVM